MVLSHRTVLAEVRSLALVDLSLFLVLVFTPFQKFPSPCGTDPNFPVVEEGLGGQHRERSWHVSWQSSSRGP